MRLGFRFLALTLLSIMLPSPSSAQVTQVLNRNVVQPEVWRPSNVEAPGIDARGDVNLQVPVLTIPGRGGLDFPVTLSYSSSIRLDDRASWVGAGWRFDPGSIAHDVFGGEQGRGASRVISYADFAGTPAFQPDRYVVTLPSGGGATMTLQNPSAGGSTFARPPRASASQFYTLDWKAWKIEPRASANGSPQGANLPVVVGQKRTGVELDISPLLTDRADYTGFTVTTEDGTRYVFENPTLASSLFTNGVERQRREVYVNSWRLVAILGPTYTGPNIPTGSEAGSWTRLDYSTPVTLDDTGDQAYVGRPFVQTTFLTRVVTPTHCASFSTEGRSRENFADWEISAYKKLKSITLYAGAQPTPLSATSGTCAGEPLRTVTLNSSPLLESEQGGNDRSRLALTSLAFTGGPGYTFEYYGRNGGGAIGKMDNFGFADTQGGYLGNFASDCSGGGACNDGASFSLKKITYPTGGSDEFVYENDLIAPNEALDYGVDVRNFRDSGTGGEPLDPGRYDFGAGDQYRRQGGARVRRIIRADGRGTAVTSNFDYGLGRVSAIPTRWWQLNYAGLPFFTPTNRGTAAVYYETITRSEPDGSSTRTAYTTSQTANVGRVQTVLWFNVYGMTIAQGNQDSDWGKTTKVEQFRDGELQAFRTTTYTLDLSRLKVAGVWQGFGSGGGTPCLGAAAGSNSWSEVSLCYGLPDLQAVTTADIANGSTAEQKTEYAYFIAQNTGNGLIQSTTTTLNDNQTKRVVSRTYGSERYPALNTANRLADVVLEQTRQTGGAAPGYYAATATTFASVTVGGGGDEPLFARGASASILLPYRTLAWDAPAASAAAPTLSPSDWTSTAVPNGWTATESITGYDANAFPTRIEDAAGLTVDIVNGPWGLPTRVSVPATGGGASLARTFRYNSSGLLDQLVDENGKLTSFAYDDGFRLAEVRGPNNEILSKATYAFGIAPGLNRVTERSYSSASAYTETVSVVDGLGRPVQSLERAADGRYVVSTTEYVQPQGSAALTRTWRPVEVGTNGTDFFSGFSAAASSTYPGDNAFTETYLRRDGTGRPEFVQHPRRSSDPVARTQYDYKVLNPGTGNYTAVETTDESDHRQITYTDAFGRDFRIDRILGQNQAAVTQTEFDVLDRPLVVSPPNTFALPSGSQASDWQTRYAYDTRSRLISAKSPDAGTVRYAYDRAGRLRYQQDEKQGAAGQVLFTTYDALGRALRRGVASAPFASVNNYQSPPFDENNPTLWLEAFQYDTQPATGAAPWNSFASFLSSSPATGVQNSAGHLVSAATRSGGVWQIEHSGYDERGRLDRRFVRTLASGATGAAVQAEFNTDLSYSYDLQGHLLTRGTTVHDRSFYHAYTYNDRGLNTAVRAGTTVPTGTPQVEYAYGPSGEIIQQKIAGRASRYVYDARGRLLTIGGATFSPSNLSGVPFTAGYEYAPNGTVTRAQFATITPGSGDPSDGVQQDDFSFTYDALDRLTGADHAGDAAYDISGIAYDRNGNITALTRRDQSGAVIDQLTYQYNRSNRVTGITDAVTSAALWDAESGAFAYDPNGNATQLPAPYLLTGIGYDYRNLPVRQQNDRMAAAYRYAASGQRYLRALSLPNVIGISESVAAAGPQAARGGVPAPTPQHAPTASGAAPGQAEAGRTTIGQAELGAVDASVARADTTRPQSRGARPSFGGVQAGRFGAPARTGQAPTTETQADGAQPADAAQPDAAAARAPSRTPGLSAEPQTSAADANGPTVARSRGLSPRTSASTDAPRSAWAGRTVRSDSASTGAPGAPLAVRAAASTAPTNMPTGGTADMTIAPDGQGTYYTALDAIVRTGTQPSVAEVSRTFNGRSTATRVEHFALLSPSGEALGVYIATGLGFTYYHKDLLGSVRAVTLAGYTVMEARTYDAWGVALAGRGGLGSATREGYTGKVRDTESTLGGTSGGVATGVASGLDYFGARYYMPALGRWTSTDPAGQHASPYLYGSNNPVSRVDPDGMWDGDYYDDKTGEFLGSDELNDGRVYTVNRRQYSISSTALVPTYGSVSAALKPVSSYVGQKYDIQDLSQDFDTEVGILSVMASNARSRVDRDNPGIGNFAAAGARFVSFVGTGSVTDLKNSASSSFSNARVATNSVGGHVFVHGRLIQPQDVGNYAYGSVSKAYNYGQSTARTGAILNQVWNGTVNGGGVRYILSETRDQYWIGLGYNRTRLNR